MKLWLVRHAQVLIDKGICYGVSDISCDPIATSNAADNFAKFPSKRATLWTSPLQRAYKLAEAIKLKRPDIQGPIVDQRLLEMDFGCWEMSPWNEIPKQNYDSWVADFANYRFGEKESTLEVIDRVSRALKDVISSRNETVWVTHAGVIKAIQYVISKKSPHKSLTAQDWPSESIALGSWICIKV